VTVTSVVVELTELMVVEDDSVEEVRVTVFEVSVDRVLV
jgi:hypothetical protein